MEIPEHVVEGPALARSGLVHRVRRGTGEPPHPTVLLLHGRAGNEDVMWIFERLLPKTWLLVAPRAITPDPEEGGFSWHPPLDVPWPHLHDFETAVAALARFVEALPDLYGADLSNLYLMGFSQGTALAYAFALNHPEKVQGIAGLVGFVPHLDPAALVTRPLHALPIFVAIGKEDATIPLDFARASHEHLRTAGADLTAREYETGHRLNSQGSRELREWIAGNWE